MRSKGALVAGIASTARAKWDRRL